MHLNFITEEVSMEDIFLEKFEQEIEQQQRNVSFDTKEYTIEIIVQK